MKIIHVSAVVLCNSLEEILIVQRPTHKEMAGLWEFPGGKIESSETPEQALQRELAEELAITVEIGNLKPLCFVSHRYSTFHLIMLVYRCNRWKGEITLKEGQQAVKWVSPSQLKDFPMPPADLPIFEYL